MAAWKQAKSRKLVKNFTRFPYVYNISQNLQRLFCYKQLTTIGQRLIIWASAASFRICDWLVVWLIDDYKAVLWSEMKATYQEKYFRWNDSKTNCFVKIGQIY